MPFFTLGISSENTKAPFLCKKYVASVRRRAFSSIGTRRGFTFSYIEPDTGSDIARPPILGLKHVLEFKLVLALNLDLIPLDIVHVVV